MNIVHYLWSSQIGGIERLVLDLAEAQQKSSKVKVKVLIGQKKGEFINLFYNRGIELAFAGLKSGADLSIKRFIWLKKFFKQFDIVHIHAFHPLVCLAAWSAGKKMVYTEHGTFGVGRELTVADYVKKYLKRFFLNHSKVFITFNSLYTQTAARKLYGLRNTKQNLVYNGTNICNKIPSQTNIDQAILEGCQGKFVIGTSSRFTPRKGIDRLIQAFAIFQKGRDTVLLLVGDGPSRDYLQKIVSELMLDSKVIFTGFRSNVTEYQNMMDVCVFPAEKEPFGLVAIETLALGKPTIIYDDGGGLTEIVRPFESKDVVKDETELAERIFFYYHNRELISAEANKRKEYVSRFSIEKMANIFFQIYQEL